MKTEMLDRLLFDRALGELTPEVAALLEEYLAQNPTAARRALELTATVQLARSAVALPRETPCPLDLDRLRRAEQVESRKVRSAEIFRLAVCLAIGLTVGWLTRSTPEKIAIDTAAIGTPSDSPREAPTPSADFWSRTRLAAEHHASPPERTNHRGHLRPDTPFKTPRWEEKL
jgi:anti-sigma factor RsiW